MLKRAGVVESVDTPALGAGAARHGGSSPSARTRSGEFHGQTIAGQRPNP